MNRTVKSGVPLRSTSFLTAGYFSIKTPHHRCKPLLPLTCFETEDVPEHLQNSFEPEYHILRHDTVAGHWELTMYDLYAARIPD